jgi:hypothetical protein
VYKRQKSKEQGHLQGVYMEFVQGPSLAILRQYVSEMGYIPILKWKEYEENVECFGQLVEPIPYPDVVFQGAHNSREFLRNIST